MPETNKDVRDAIYDARLRNYQVAEMVGWAEATFYRKLRKELPEGEKKAILEIIKSAAE